jgi:hypothetical protein
LENDIEQFAHLTKINLGLEASAADGAEQTYTNMPSNAVHAEEHKDGSRWGYDTTNTSGSRFGNPIGSHSPDGGYSARTPHYGQELGHSMQHQRAGATSSLQNSQKYDVLLSLILFLCC